jgi:hypothetical protein
MLVAVPPPESTGGGVPVSRGVWLPESSGVWLPESSGVDVPESSGVDVPESWGALVPVSRVGAAASRGRSGTTGGSPASRGGRMMPASITGGTIVGGTVAVASVVPRSGPKPPSSTPAAHPDRASRSSAAKGCPRGRLARNRYKGKNAARVNTMVPIERQIWAFRTYFQTVPSASSRLRRSCGGRRLNLCGLLASTATICGLAHD